jgi:uncharacterized protein YjbI with pentapeptide repeats
MSNRYWFGKLSEDERQNLRNEIKNKISDGLAVPNTKYLLQLIDEHKNNHNIREAWNDNFDQWYEIIKKYAKPENDAYVSCEHLFYQGFWSSNVKSIDLNAIEKHWQGKRKFSFKEFKFILPVKLTGETGLSYFQGAVFLSEADFKGANFSRLANFQGAKFSSGADFKGAKFSYEADFKGANFSRLANFQGAKFSSGADFKGANFSYEAYFANAKFLSGADFKGANFSYEAYFNGAKFSYEADFKGAKFSSWVIFIDAEFSHWAFFQDASFADEISFLESKFLNSPPDFTGIKEFNYPPLFDCGPEALEKQFPTQTCQSSPTGNEEAYRKLKIIAKQHENSELEGFCYRRELLCKYYRLKKQKTDKLIRCGIDAYERLFSCGWSIIKPISSWLMLTMIFTLLYYLVLHVMPSGITSVAIIMMVVFLAGQIIFAIPSRLFRNKFKVLRRYVKFKKNCLKLISKCQPLLKCKFIRWLGVVLRLRNWQYIKLLLFSVVMLILAVMLPDETSFSFKQSLPIVSGLDSLGRTYDEIFPQRRMLHPQCGRVEDDGKKSDEESDKKSDEESDEEINEAIAEKLPQCKIPTALMILAIIHKISSGILIFMFLLALRNNFKMS